MFRFVLFRRIVSSITILMLVWCQTSAIAQAGLIELTAPVAEVSATAPCHQTAAESPSNTPQQTDCQSRCQSHNAWFETDKVHLPAIDDLLLAVISLTLFAPVEVCAAPNDRTAERAAPPPLILVYGRLLI